MHNNGINTNILICILVTVNPSKKKQYKLTYSWYSNTVIAVIACTNVYWIECNKLFIQLKPI